MGGSLMENVNSATARTGTAKRKNEMTCKEDRQAEAFQWRKYHATMADVGENIAPQMPNVEKVMEV